MNKKFEALIRNKNSWEKILNVIRKFSFELLFMERNMNESFSKGMKFLKVDKEKADNTEILNL